MEGKSNFNLIAIGGFSWFLIMSLSALYFSSLGYLLIPFIEDPSNAFWTVNIAALVLTILSTYGLTKGVWNKISKEDLRTNRTMTYLVVAVIITHILQGLSAYHLPFVSYRWNSLRTDAYYNFLQETPSMEFASGAMDIVVILSISIFFIKWKR